jgi:protein arginine kinase activator
MKIRFRQAPFRSPVFSAASCPRAPSGQLGCHQCYQTFFDHLKDLLRRIHGSNEHLGKVPRSSRDKFLARRKLNKLQQQLKTAIESEDFERAALLRDKIQRLQHIEKKISPEEAPE